MQNGQNMNGQNGQNSNGQQNGQNGSNGNDGNSNDKDGNSGSSSGGSAGGNGKMAAMLGGPVGLAVAGAAVYFLFCRRSGFQTNAGGDSESEMSNSDKGGSEESGS